MRLVVSPKKRERERERKLLVIPYSFILIYTVISPYTHTELVFFNWLLRKNYKTDSLRSVYPSFIYMLWHKFPYKKNLSKYMSYVTKSIIYLTKLILSFPFQDYYLPNFYINYNSFILAIHFYCFISKKQKHIILVMLKYDIVDDIF